MQRRTLSEILQAPQAPQKPQNPLIRNGEYIEPQKWKKPKPNFKFNRDMDLKIGNLVAIDNYGSGKITAIGSQGIGINQEKPIHHPNEVFKLFPTNTSSVKIQDFISFNEKPEYLYVCTKIEQDSITVQTVDGTATIPKGLIENVYSFDTYTIQGTQFLECIRYKGETYKNEEELQEKFKDTKIVVQKKDITYSEYVLRKHLNVPEDRVLQDKSNSIMQVLRETLTHPLNTEVKRWALLYGPSGTGKTELGVRFCKEQNLEYVKVQGTSQLTVDDLLGFKSITTGEYHPSLLRDAVQNGKVFILDEIDACNSNVLLVLNGLKQERFQFPDGLVEVHPNFKLIGTANTLEYSEEYNARMPLDKATLARFKKIEYTMDMFDLAIRYGAEYISKIQKMHGDSIFEELTAREIEGMVIDLKIDDTKKTGDKK